MDYINVMKTCKRYHDLAEMYHFNPIGDFDLFENMETQHIYSYKERKRQGMIKYIYWYSTEELKEKLKENEIIKPIDIYKYIRNNNDKLKEWSECKQGRRLYDSDRDVFTKKTFENE